ncbi:1-deoxy-D-xylulose-5-phosphate synthase [Candidatus Marinimicrobia bacterium MT.SAG.4]|nr:1-deoxy-D-xylulose-5-phosphate synthase [Candidatus Marinimicrobia bacterium MT.SAG.4]
MSEKLLNNVQLPEGVKDLSLEALKSLCDEIRDRIIKVVTEKGGHFGGPLGAVELTVALHHVYNSPVDKMIWDVGHQAYAHKILTGRNAQFDTIRQYKGLSGFLKRSESEHDAFGAGHASTSISSSLGFAKAMELQGKDSRAIAIIGDGGMTGGLAFEALNNVGQLKTDMLIILNDNEMSISKNVGAVSQLFTRMLTNPLYNRVRDELWNLTGKLPMGKKRIRLLAKRIDEGLKNLIVPGIFFEELGIRYFGPINGHDLEVLISTLQKLNSIKGPKILHIITRKGKGYEPAEIDPVTWHGIKGSGKSAKPPAPDYLKVFGDIACEFVENNEKVCLITAAMKEGTGLVEFAEKYPDKFFDVGIAEGHAVTFSAGLAAQGMKPIVAIYSTFLQRAYDHMIHDVAIQNLPVIFVLDRAGLVGPDGPTHQGVFDLSYLQTIPNMTVCAPKDGNELRNLLYTALEKADGPFAVRYPKDCSIKYEPELKPEILKIGTWEKLQDGKEVVLLAVGSMVENSLKAREILLESDIFAGVVNCRFIKPFDTKMMQELATEYSIVITIEENTRMGGFGANLRNWCAENVNIRESFHTLAISDEFVTHGPRKQLLDDVGLSPEKIADYISNLIKKTAKSRNLKELVK